MNAFVETLRSLGPVRLATMAGVAAGILAFFIYLTSRLATPEMSLLYGDLDNQDSGQIVSRLEEMNVPYQMGANGEQIFVPSDQVGRLRIAMAEEGLPNGGSIGYEIFDRAEGLGTTNFVQNINHLRALEGELARTIRSVESVKQARVHLVLPKRELFSRERQKPSASIVVAMEGNNRLDRGQVRSIQHMVAAAVPELQPKMISIVDNQGTLLARGTDADDPQTAASNAEEMRRNYEARLAQTIEELLERSVGPGNVRAEVTAEMDFDRVTENAEIYDPDGQVVRSTQTVEESADSQDGEGAQGVTVGNNLPDQELPGLGGEAGSQSRSNRIEETVNYEISRTVKTHVRESGDVQRLSVAVLVNGAFVEDAEGELVYEPRGEEEIEQLASLVRSAVGYDEARGDTVEIVNMRFFDLETELEATAGLRILGFSKSEVMRVVELLVLGIVAILVLLFVVRPLVSRVLEAAAAQSGGTEDPGLLPDPTGMRPALAGPELPGSGGAGGGEGGKSGVPAEAEDNGADELEQMMDMNKVEGRVRASAVRKISEIVERHPEEAAGILRTWLYQEGS